MPRLPATIRPLVIIGPTAGGKSELAVRLAQSVGPTPRLGEIISADSMQIYRQLDAGTAKPTAAQRAAAPHHLIDIIEPTERFTVADWLARADHLIDAIRGRFAVPIVVGGTNLYIKALLEGLFAGPPHDPAFRAAMQQLTGDQLHQRLQQVDPPAAARIHANDRKKLVRALEVFHATGKPISAWQQQWGREEGVQRRSDAETQRRSDGGEEGADGDAGHKSEIRNQKSEMPVPASEIRNPESEIPYRHDPIVIGLDWPVDVINQRINLRVKAMFFPDKVSAELAAQVTPRGESIVDETRRLEAQQLLGAQARQALGYKQVLAYLHGERSLDEAFERTKILTRRFAKTQRTWLKRYRRVHWLDAADQDLDRLAAQAIEVVKRAKP